MINKPLEIEYCNPELLKRNDWNTNIVDPTNQQKINNSLKRHGMFNAVIVRELKDGTLELIGGEHRVDEMIAEGYDKAPYINLGKLTREEAIEISLIDNGRYGTDDTLQLASLLNELEDMSDLLPYTDEQFSAIFSVEDIDLDLLEFDEEDAIELDKEPVESVNVKTHQIMRFKVPIEDSPMITELFEHIMSENNFIEEDSLSNAGDALIYLCNHFDKKISK